MQHSISSRKHRCNPVTRPQVHQSARLFHTISSHTDTQVSQQTGSADGNRRGTRMRPDHGSNHKVFVWCGLTCIDPLCVRIRGLRSQRHQHHHHETAARHWASILQDAIADNIRTPDGLDCVVSGRTVQPSGGANATRFQKRPRGTKISAVQLVIRAKSLANFRSSHGLPSRSRTMTSPPTIASQMVVTISTAAIASISVN
jgi:hypothetical protein